MFAKCFARIVLQYVPEGSGSWKYNHYFPVAKGEGKITVLSLLANWPCPCTQLLLFCNNVTELK